VQWTRQCLRITVGTASLAAPQIAPYNDFVIFHQGWCNSSSCVNETLQNLQIVLVSDPFTKDSEHTAELSFLSTKSMQISGDPA
jgi:hypothetical protein